MSHDLITRCTRLAALLAALAATPAAMAFVTTTTVGNTTTYFEDFNGGTDFYGDAWTPNSPTHFTDNFIELSLIAGSSSSFVFTSAGQAARRRTSRPAGRWMTPRGRRPANRRER